MPGAQAGLNVDGRTRGADEGLRGILRDLPAGRAGAR